QYRSALFPTDDLQAQKVKVYIEKLKAINKFSGEIVTTIEEGAHFYGAENDHQDYLANNPGGYCHIGFDVFQKLKMGIF
ncbi:MAG: peptide-methionine (S)-S-oxide reductase, partial [Halobacteriovoraceae bacterium]|nr:peptide-methionine (S)-S-oxide reductase [Halobacteriovoraceae bacterium]